ncbi:hypothetical protein FVEN_g867 [Fusarium venenatum]|uniref:uncharacterized protein n=1 Tax=Fusarium venenatum TaxID=56646 RepID=UPI001D82A81D|nr:hypothetical protein FVEN_g867 [Fusarium venenatum]KAH6967306.1 hypothetical protein EDB82DRAFT_356188 [Fusarium venenatum]
MDCYSGTLSSLVGMEEVEFDADIAALGVLIAFVATSLAVIIVLVFAFLTLSVPSRLHNTGDAVMAAGMRRFYRRLRVWLPKLKRFVIEMHTVSRIPRRLQQCIDTDSTDGLSTIEKEALYIHIRLRRNWSDDLEGIYRQLQFELFDKKSKTTTLSEIWQKVDEKERNNLLNEWLRLKALSLLAPEIKGQSHLWLHDIMTAERWAFHQCCGSFVWRLL